MIVLRVKMKWSLIVKINFILAFCLKIRCIWNPYWRCADLCGFFFLKMWGFLEFSSGATDVIIKGKELISHQLPYQWTENSALWSALRSQWTMKLWCWYSLFFHIDTYRYFDGSYRYYRYHTDIIDIIPIFFSF